MTQPFGTVSLMKDIISKTWLLSSENLLQEGDTLVFAYKGNGRKNDRLMFVSDLRTRFQIPNTPLIVGTKNWSDPITVTLPEIPSIYLVHVAHEDAFIKLRQPQMVSQTTLVIELNKDLTYSLSEAVVSGTVTIEFRHEDKIRSRNDFLYVSPSLSHPSVLLGTHGVEPGGQMVVDLPSSGTLFILNSRFRDASVILHVV